jgi:hypothetical protein
MHDTPMTLDEFEMQLDRHGADVDAWPANEAAAARRLLATSSEATYVLADARAIAALLYDAFPATTPTTRAVRERIIADVENDAMRPRGFAWLAHLPRVVRPIAAAAALIPLSVGFVIGVGFQPGVNDDLVSDVSLLAFVAYEEVSNGDQ